LTAKDSASICTTNNPCLNGGSCQLTSSSQPVCICPTGYSGNNCQTKINAPSSCANLVCKNGGTCRTIGTASACSCPVNVYGPNCEYVVTQSTCNADDTNKASCEVWNSMGYCSFVYSYNSIPLPIYCPKSCSLCKNVGTCTDSQTSCSVWAGLGLCDLVNQKDQNLCKKSCGLC
jgi:hypothetical protein